MAAFYTLSMCRMKDKKHRLNGKTLLLVDFSNLFYKSVNAYAQLEFNDIRTGGLFGFVKQLSSAISAYNADVVIVCDDSRPYVREKYVPQYKQGRKEEPDLDKKRMNALNRSACKEFLNNVGVFTWEKKGYEADDLITCARYQYRNKFDNIIVKSNDSDLFQLFSDRFNGKAALFFDRKGPTFPLYTKQDFLDEFSISPSKWAWVQAFSGHNNLPKIKGVGPATALKICSDKKELAAMREQHTFLDTNYRMTALPFGNKFFTLPSYAPNHPVMIRKAVQLLAKFGINPNMGGLISTFEKLEH